jgi:hypothetical protein
MGESECHYRQLLKSVKLKVSCFFHFFTVCFLFAQLGRNRKNNLNFDQAIVRFETVKCLDFYLDSVDLTQLASTKMAKSEVKMTILSIQSIFSNLSFYQDHYLEIIEDPQQYYTSVENCFLNTFPFKQQALFLGDLLQLWFGDKWKIQNAKNLLTQKNVLTVNEHFPLYLFQLGGELILGANTALAWSVAENKIVAVQVKSIWQYAVFSHLCSRPKNYHENKAIA